MNQKTLFDYAVAERLLGLTSGGPAMDLRTDGIYMTQDYADAVANCVDWLRWNPQWVLLESNPQTAPLLPIPFSGCQLAAFLLCPVAYELMERFGPAGELDEQAMEACFRSGADGMNRQAIQDAYSHLQRAAHEVGPKSTALFDAAEGLAVSYEKSRDLARIGLGIATVSSHGLSDALYTRRINEANEAVSELKGSVTAARARAEAGEIDWLRRMTKSLFSLANVGIAEESGKSAPPPLNDSAKEGPNWDIRKPERYPGYSLPLYKSLAAAHRAGKPRPSATDIAEEWRDNKPAEIVNVTADSIAYYDSTGGVKTATYDAIRKAIKRMTASAKRPLDGR